MSIFNSLQSLLAQTPEVPAPPRPQTEGAAEPEGVVRKSDVDLYALGHDDLPLLKAQPRPLRDFKPHKIVVFGLNEVV